MAIKAKQANKNLIIISILSAVFSVALVGLGWFFVIKSSMDVNRLRTNVSSLKEEADKLTDLAIRFKKVESQEAIVYEAISTQKDISTFMADFEDLAIKDIITINNAQVGNTLSKNNVSGEFSQTISKSEYYELPIKYTVSGTYTNFTKFIVDLNTLRRLNSVTDLVVTQDISDQKITDKVKATFTITIYSKKQAE